MRRLLGLVVLLLLSFGQILAQDTLRVSAPDTAVHKQLLQPKKMILPTKDLESREFQISDSLPSSAAKAKIDKSLDKKAIAKEQKELPKPKKLFYPDPNKAMWYGLICPGLGQIYNRRYWKLPIVYGGFAALGYGISYYGKNYKTVRRYYSDIVDNNPNTKSYEELYGKYDPSYVTPERLKDYMNSHRRSRDLCIIGTVAFYAITVLDAFVDASLANFDIAPDLSLRVAPTVIQADDNTHNLGLSLNVTF